MTYHIQQIPWASPHSKEVRQIRFTVFVDEQKVPAELELDEFDNDAVHILAVDKDNYPCGTARMFSDPDDSERVKIGRMAVLIHARGTGCGSVMLQHLLKIARLQGYHEAILTAQTHAIQFYEKLGFIKEGSEFLDAGIPHYYMRLKL